MLVRYSGFVEPGRAIGVAIDEPWYAVFASPSTAVFPPSASYSRAPSPGVRLASRKT